MTDITGYDRYMINWYCEHEGRTVKDVLFSYCRTKDWFVRNGWYLDSTGGSCMAWHYDLPGRYVLVTNDDGVDAPLWADENVYLGVYNQAGDQFDVHTLRLFDLMEDWA